MAVTRARAMLQPEQWICYGQFESGVRSVGTGPAFHCKAGKHSAAVQRYLETGDNSALAKFKGKYIVDAQGKRIALMTDLDDLDRLGSAGELSFESLYARNL